MRLAVKSGDLVKRHSYRVKVEWTGNLGAGTSSYAGYSRDHTIDAGLKPQIAGSSDPAFRGDTGRWNPEELLLASVTACHKLWYLGLCAAAGISVLRYVDEAEATMIEDSDGSGRFAAAVLRPRVTIAAGADLQRARDLHREAHRRCFIANSVNFPVTCEASVAADVEAGC